MATVVLRRRVYVAAALAATVIAFVGFWRTYFGPFLAGTVDASALIHTHAAIFVGWLALFIAQVVLAATGRIALHKRLGNWVMAYGVFVVVGALLAAWDGFGARLDTVGEVRAERWLFGILRDLVFFVPFLVAGWLYRRQPETHKRLMLVATTILVMPAIGRMVFLGLPPPLWAYLVVWPVPVYIAMAHDFRTRRLVHPVYLIGLAAMLAMRLVLPLREMEWWHAIAASLTALYVELR